MAFRFNPTTGQLDIAFDDSTGESSLIVTLNCDASVYVGAAVYLGVGDIAFNAIADDISTSLVFGFTISKPTATTCRVRVAGITENIFSGITEGSQYFLSDNVAGEISTSIPTTSGYVIAPLGTALTDQTIAIAIQARMKRA